MPAEYYASPRWSKEITDCSMPMTFDTYSKCSYGCLYCFSIFQKGVGQSKASYFGGGVRFVNIDRVKRIFQHPDCSQFGQYVKERRPMQWGGLADQFDEFERKHGKTLELLRFFHSIRYPICFSTKATWWTTDSRYTELFAGMPWNVKFSIITDNERYREVVERGCPSTKARFEAMSTASKFVEGGVTLRLRPFIIGITNPGHVSLIHRAADCGASAVSTEFFCMELRYPDKQRYHDMSRIAGYDMLKFYKKYSCGAGYLRLNRNIKRPFVDSMEQACLDRGLRFYVSDAHFKERCCNGSCCGLTDSWNYTRGQFCEAVVLCKRQGTVSWSDISKDLDYAKQISFRNADGYNPANSGNRAVFYSHTMYDFIRWCWNNPESGQSPYRMYEGIMKPEGLDENGDVVYVYDETRA